MGTINTEHLRRAIELLDEADYYMQKAYSGVEGKDAIECYDFHERIENLISDLDDIHDMQEAIDRRIAEEARLG